MICHNKKNLALAGAVTPGNQGKHKVTKFERKGNFMSVHSNTGTIPSEALIMACVEPVKRMAYTYCGSQSNYEDFVSIGMVKVCEVVASGVMVEYPIAYLCTAARNAMIDEYHRARRLSLVSLDAPVFSDLDALALVDILPSSSPVSSESDGDDHLIDVVEVALCCLNSLRRRRVLRYRYGIGTGVHTVEEIAKALGLKREAVRKADYHVRGNLRYDVRLRAAVEVE
jgi:RNA polymerase sigma factor (sigma-70 family)